MINYRFRSFTQEGKRTLGIRVSLFNFPVPLFARLQSPSHFHFLFAFLEFSNSFSFHVTIIYSQLKPRIRILLQNWFHIRTRVHAHLNWFSNRLEFGARNRGFECRKIWKFVQGRHFRIRVRKQPLQSMLHHVYMQQWDGVDDEVRTI